MDQELYFEIYDSGSRVSVSHGNFHHGHFPGRTQPLSDDDFNLVIASGSMVQLNFKGLPADKEGGWKICIRGAFGGVRLYIHEGAGCEQQNAFNQSVSCEDITA